MRSNHPTYVRILQTYIHTYIHTYNVHLYTLPICQSIYTYVNANTFSYMYMYIDIQATLPHKR